MKNKYGRCLSCSWVRLLTLHTRSHRQWTSGLCLHLFVHTEHPSEHRNEFWRTEDYFHVPLIAAHLTQPFWEGGGLTFLSKGKRFRLCFWLFPFQAETYQRSCWWNSCDNAHFTAQLVGNHKFSGQVSVTFTLSHVLFSNRKNIHTYIYGKTNDIIKVLISVWYPWGILDDWQGAINARERKRGNYFGLMHLVV